MAGSAFDNPDLELKVGSEWVPLIVLNAARVISNPR